MTISGETVFLDTNVLIRANIEEAPLHAESLRVIKTLRPENTLWISRQVLREFIAILTRPQGFADPRPTSTIIERVRYFQTRFHVADDIPLVTENLLTLLSRIPMGGRQVHDANIVATMQAYGVTHLLTHNTDDFARFSGEITILALNSMIGQSGA